jgi:hypothetical protein
MKRPIFKTLSLAIGLAFAGGASAVNLDFSGSNIYMKFLDGNRRVISDSSGDTASGADQGQWTEFELRIKAVVSPQVEAGVRLQSRSSASYWTNFGFANNEGFGGINCGNAGQPPCAIDYNPRPTQSKYIKLRGAYVQLTPGYNWLNTALIGSSDWGYFDPFTVGKVRYIDRDNYNGFYFTGPVYGGGTWEAARISLPNYLQSHYGQGSACCATDSTQFNEAVYILQGKRSVGPVKLAASYQQFNDHERNPTDTNPLDGTDRNTFSKNRVASLKADFSPMSGIDLRGAYYRSSYRTTGVFDQPWINSPKSGIGDRAFKLDADFSSLGVPNLSVNAQYFNIGAGYYSNTAARRESDVLLTEGSEAAWFKYGDNLWHGGAAKEYQQSAATPKGGLYMPSANGLTDNDFIDFDEAPAESVLGWKGLTLVANYEVAKTPLSLELTTIGYDNNWQGYPSNGPLSHFYPADSDRKTNIVVFKASHVFPVMGGLEGSFKLKRVGDKDKGSPAPIVTPNGNRSDDVEIKDTGYSFALGNQLFGDLYGSISYGNYKRDIDALDGDFGLKHKNSIWSLRGSYNLSGLEIGMLAQWINGDVDINLRTGAPAPLPIPTAAHVDVRQYRMKAYLKAIF